MYKKVQHPTHENEFGIVKDDTVWIALHEKNPEYLLYLEWVEAGNIAEPLNLNLETTQE